MTISHRAKATRTVAALAATASLGCLILNTPGPAGADPRPVLTGVGSDTTQDVMNGLAGVGLAPPAPLVASGKSIASWDAILGSTTGTCITPKAPGATFDRPNGSSNGRRALSRAIDGTLWTVTGSTCPAPGGSSVSGLVDFARSSAGPATGSGSGPLMYLPLGRDALSFAYAAPGVATPVTSLSSAQLNTLFTAGPQVINGVEIIPCSIQTGSGTYQSWNTAIGVSAAQMASATTTCRTAPGVVAPGELQENHGDQLRTRADSFPGKQVIIGFSAANFISQSNGVVTSNLTLGGVDLGEIVTPGGNLGKPYTGTGAALSPSTTFYANTTFGRTVYNVVQGSKITGPGNNDLKLMFAQTALGTPAVCSAGGQSTVNTYGFASLPTGAGAGNCGDTSLTGPLLTGNGTL
jgi:hypothetical protein